MKLSRIDMFAKDVPGLNFEGQTKIRTGIGAFFTIIVMTLTLALGASKTVSMWNQENFVTQVDTVKGQFVLPNDTMNLTDFDFMVAFKVADYKTHANKDDPNMVRWLGEVVEDDGFKK